MTAAVQNADASAGVFARTAEIAARCTHSFVVRRDRWFAIVGGVVESQQLYAWQARSRTRIPYRRKLLVDGLSIKVSQSWTEEEAGVRNRLYGSNKTAESV